MPLVVAAVVLPLILVFELMYWGKVAPGVQAMGADVGGLTREEALQRMSALSAELLDRPLRLHTGAWTRTATPRELGLRLDADEMVDVAFAVGREGHLLARLNTQLNAALFGHPLDELGMYDRTATEAYLKELARELDRPSRNANIALDENSRVQFTAAASGQELDIPASARQIAQAISTKQPEVGLVTRELPPAVRDDQLEPARRELELILGGPLVLRFEEQEWKLAVPDIARMVTLEVKPGAQAVVRIDDRPLRARMDEIAAELQQEPRNARFDWTSGKLSVLLESKDGRSLDPAQSTQLALESLRAGERQVKLPVQVTPPAVSSKNPAELGIRELIDQGKTSFAGSIAEKKHNIRLAAERLNGVVVPPGGLFSFNKEVGPTTLEAGFKWGYGITSSADGIKTVPSVAGGICQVATTLFQPVFWSGYQLEQRHWHLYWIPAYTSRGVVGLDVTVDEASGLDFQFINPTAHFLLIQAWTTQDELHFALYGQKPKWTVEVDEPVITAKSPPNQQMVFEAAPTLPWGQRLQVETAREGFESLVVRRVIDGSDVRTLRLKSSYQPSRNVTLVGTQGAPPGQDLDALLAGLRAAESEQNKPVRGANAENGAEQGAKPTPEPTSAAPAQKPGAAQTSEAAPKEAQPNAPQVAPTTAPAAPAPVNGQSVEVPVVRGMRAEDAAVKIGLLGLKVQQAEVEAEAPRGIVVSQVPQAGSAVPPDSTVMLNVSKGD